MNAVATKRADKAALLSALRSAGVVGMTRTELFDSAHITRPSALAEQLREDGHAVGEEVVKIDGTLGPETGRTTRYTLLVDADPQGTLLEGERTEQLGTWQDTPVEWAER